MSEGLKSHLGDRWHIGLGVLGGLLWTLFSVATQGAAGFDPWKAVAYMSLGGVAGFIVPDENPVVVIYHALTAPAVIALFRNH